MERGYQVPVPVDAGGGLSERTERAAFRQIEAAGAVRTSVVSIATTLAVVSIATTLAPDFTADRSKRMFALVQQLRLA